MNDDNFEAPPTFWVILTVIGGIATALSLIVSLEYLGDRLSPDNHMSPEDKLSSNSIPFVGWQ